MCSALCHENSANWHPTSRAWFPGLLIDVVPHLKTSLAPVEVHVIRHRRATRIYRFAKYFPDCQVQLFYTVPSEPARDGHRMDSRAKQGFICVDIPDATQESLVQKQGLDFGLAPLNAQRKVLEGYFQRLRTQLPDARRQSCTQL